MPTIKELAGFADAVYSYPYDLKNYHLLHHNEPNDQDYKADAYVNGHKKEVIIAHRGTHPTRTGDMKNDVLLSLEIPTNAQQLAAEFALSLAEKYPDYKFINVGHSLGGNNAQAAVAALADAGLESSGVTFNAPGASNFRHAEDPASYNVLNIMGHTDIVSLAGGQHFGKTVILPAGPDLSGLFSGTSALILNSPISPFIAAGGAIIQLFGPAHSMRSVGEYLTNQDPSYGSKPWSHYDDFHSVAERSWQVSVDKTGKIKLDLDGMTLESSIDLLTKSTANYLIKSKDSSGADVVFENNNNKFLYERSDEISWSEFKRSEGIVSLKQTGPTSSGEMIRNSNGDLKISVSSSDIELDLVSYDAGIVLTQEGPRSSILLSTRQDNSLTYEYNLDDGRSWKGTINPDKSRVFEIIDTGYYDHAHLKKVSILEETGPTGLTKITTTMADGRFSVYEEQRGPNHSGKYYFHPVTITFDENGKFETIDTGAHARLEYEDGKFVGANMFEARATYSHHDGETKFTSNFDGESKFFSSTDSKNEVSTSDYSYIFRDGMLEYYRDDTLSAQITEYRLNENGSSLFGDDIMMSSSLGLLTSLREEMPDGSRIEYQISDGLGLTKAVIDMEGNVQYIERDTVFGKSTDYKSENRIDYIDFGGKLISQKYSGTSDDREISYNYLEGGGRLVLTEYSVRGSEEVLYSPDGKILSFTLTLPDSSSKKTEYDENGRISKVIEVSEFGAKFTTEFLVAGGRIETQETDSFTEITKFDERNRPELITQSYDDNTSNVIGYSYNADGSYTSNATNLDTMVFSVFNSDGRLLELTTTTSSYKQTVTYGISGDHVGRTEYQDGSYHIYDRTSGVTTTDIFNANDIRVEQSISSPSGHLRKIFDLVGVLVKEVESGATGFKTTMFWPSGVISGEEYQGPLGSYVKTYSEHGNLESDRGRDTHGKSWEISYDQIGREVSNAWRQGGVEGLKLLDENGGNYLGKTGLAGAKEGSYSFADGETNSIIFGRAGDDVLKASSGKNLIAGSYGDDLIHLNLGQNVILFNMGDGRDTLVDFHRSGGVISLGNNINIELVELSQIDNDLVIKFAAQDSQQLKFKDWYANTATDSDFYLQFFKEPLDSSEGPVSAEIVNLYSLIQEFDAAKTLNEDAFSWLLPADLSSFRLAGSSSGYFGGALTIGYAQDHNTQVDLIGMRSVLMNREFLE